MTRLLTCGFETGDINEAGGTPTTGTNSTLAAVSAVPTPRGGSYCIKGSSSLASSNNWAKPFGFAAKTEVWVRFAIYWHGLTTVEVAIAKLTDSGATDTADLTFSGADGLLRARQGGTSTGTLLGASSTAMTQDAWHLVEWRHQMTSLTVGVTEVWLDGTRVINFSGDNTAGSQVNVVSLSIGQMNVVGLTNIYSAFDDLVINDTNGTVNNARPGDGRIVLLTPSGAGSNTNQTRGGTDTGANYSQCNELPPSLTQYVYSATAATRDTYAMSDLPSGVGSINAAEVLVLAQNSDTGAGSLGLTVVSGGTTNEGTAQSLGSTAGYIRQLYETDPNTSAAWTVSGVNAMEAGVTVR